MRAKDQKLLIAALPPLIVLLILANSCWARPNASPKFSVVREESKTEGKESLILPCGFPSESMGSTFGIGGMFRGYGQKQVLLASTVFGSNEDAKGFIGGMWDYRLRRQKDTASLPLAQLETTRDRGPTPNPHVDLQVLSPLRQEQMTLTKTILLRTMATTIGSISNLNIPSDGQHET